MQNPIQKFKHGSIVFEEPGILPEKLKTLRSYNYHRVEHFLLKFCAHFLLNNVYKTESGIFLFCLDLELLAKVKKALVFHIFINNSRSKQNKRKIPNTLL